MKITPLWRFLITIFPNHWFRLCSTMPIRTHRPPIRSLSSRFISLRSFVKMSAACQEDVSFPGFQ
ncbi:Serine protease HTRA2 [Trichinella spiralis]|uniref:Serine protease HTRA2 n=1 Tax=Trichinella spiralis TaxID=6334 RepID=A0ABR3KZV4_TRISP